MSITKIKTVIFWIGVACTAIFAFLADFSLANEKVTVEAAVARVKDKKDQLEVTITIEIQDGWHIYAELPKDHPSILTKIDIANPKGIKDLGNMARPETIPDKNEPGVAYYEGKAVFKQKLKIEKQPEDKAQIEIKVRYQACTDQMCQPPKTKTIKLDLPK